MECQVRKRTAEERGIVHGLNNKTLEQLLEAGAERQRVEYWQSCIRSKLSTVSDTA